MESVNWVNNYKKDSEAQEKNERAMKNNKIISQPITKRPQQ
jgi:hypothetical protein